MRGKKIISFIVCLLFPLIIGGIAGYITRDETGNGTWFSSLIKPSFNPPNWLFGPVWTTLYILMGISLYLIGVNSAENTRKKGVFIFTLQLFFNFMWSILFFHYHMIFASVINILILWICIVWMIIKFKEINPIAGYLQIPYLLWVSFASILDISIWILNR